VLSPHTEVISKFRFSKPTTDLNTTLQHDNEEDLIVTRRKNEFLEIGENYLNESME
jgi:hypothetical protein